MTMFLSTASPGWHWKSFLARVPLTASDVVLISRTNTDLVRHRWSTHPLLCPHARGFGTYSRRMRVGILRL